MMNKEKMRDIKYLVGKLPVCNHKIGYVRHAFQWDADEELFRDGKDDRNVYHARCSRCRWTFGDIVRLTLRIVRAREKGTRLK